MHNLLLKHYYALGDTVLMTALVRDIHQAHPGQFRLWVRSNWSRVWENNPHATFVHENQPLPHGYPDRPRIVELQYLDGIRATKELGERVHFLSWYHRDFTRQTGVRITPSLPRADLHLSARERRPLATGRYWVIVAGGKLDMTTKHWHPDRWQAVVDLLRPNGIRFVQVGATHYRHVHPRLRGVLDLVGRTENVRDLFTLIHHADGVLCNITGAMHIAAAFEKPCVVVAGGREEASWEGYTNEGQWPDTCAPVLVPHKYLHTLGRLDCCTPRGCWRVLTVPLEPADEATSERRNKLCVLPVRDDPAHPIPKCLDLITPVEVVEAVLAYYRDGWLAPLRHNGGGDMPNAPEPILLRDPSAPATLSPPPPPSPPPPKPPPTVFNHPEVGGKFTICVLCYGPHTQLAQRCLDSILRTCPPGTVDLRVACNACSPETVRYLRGLPSLTRLYVHPENRLKYPVMREMFRDPEHPITTSHVIWFDDDSFVVDPGWLEKLAAAVIEGRPRGVALYGMEFLHDFDRYRTAGHDPGAWFQSAPWYKGRYWHLGRDRRHTGPNGTVIRFVTGGWWCMLTRAIHECDVPDARLRHNGGDCTIGAQVHQGGYTTASVNEGKKLVHSSGAPPRGVSHTGSPEGKRFPWSNPSSD